MPDNQMLVVGPLIKIRGMLSVARPDLPQRRQRYDRR
jgi:hypothetical protein